jgi:hypothetical protein
MAYENVEFVYPNFCISPTTEVFCSIDHGNDVMQIKNDSGTLLAPRSLDTGVIEIKSLEYPGPRNTGVAYGLWGDNLPFFTLEHTSDSQCTIREWRLKTTAAQLQLENTIVKTTGGSNYFNCYDMAIEHYHTTFASNTAIGTGKIQLTAYDNIEVGDKLLLGLSSDPTNLNASEWVEVTSVSGSWVYLTASGVTPTVYEYINGDDITYSKAIWLFSEIGQNNDSTKGSLYKLDINDGSVVEVENSGLYSVWNATSEWSAAAWSLDYDALGFVKGNNVIYVDPNNNYYVTKSQTATNTDDDDATILPVYDLVFDTNSIYRLQKKITLRDDGGDKTTTDWTTYNYHRDTLVPYTLSISLSVDPDGIVLNNESIYLTAVVRDQFGVGLSSKTLFFSKTGDAGGEFTPIDGQVTTNSSGVATIQYTTDYYDPAGAFSDGEEIVISAKTTGGSTDLGITGYAGWIWDDVSVSLWRKFTTDIEQITQKPTLSGTWPTEGSDLYSQTYLTQIVDRQEELSLIGLSKFQFPGGHWRPTGAPVDVASSVRQLEQVSDQVKLDQLPDDVENELPLIQDKQVEKELQFSQTYISRHLTSGHKDTTQINQFQFIADAIPAFGSEKNPINTNIWIRLRPFGFDLDQITLVFKVKEVSYVEDTGYTDVTALCSVSLFDAGGGLDGLDITYDPAQNFHYNAVVFVSIEVYDQAPTPNIILTDYWFKIIPDFKAPHIVNESPAREAEDVLLDTNISFDVLDVGIGVNIDTLEFYVNNRIKLPNTTTISGGYHVSYNPPEEFFYGQTVEIIVKVKDASGYENVLYDMWRFYCVGSTGPWIDRSSIYPKTCAAGVHRKQTNISVNVYAIDDTGVDRESLLIEIGGKERDVRITPIVYRLS